MKITVETLVNAAPAKVWDAWNTPEDIKRWNSAHESWHTTRSEVDLREGGTFVSRMEAKDGSAGFDFGGTYTRVVPGRGHGIPDERRPRGRGGVRPGSRRRPGPGDVRRGERELGRAPAARDGRRSWTTSAATWRRRAEPERRPPIGRPRTPVRHRGESGPPSPARRCATGALSPAGPFARSSQRPATPPPTSGEGLPGEFQARGQAFFYSMIRRCAHHVA